MLILGIDPGQHTGIAHYLHGQLARLVTLPPERVASYIENLAPDLVIFEDSRLQSNVWTKARGAAALKVARNIGEIDAWCKLITAVCEGLDIPAHGISPKGKGAKLDAVAFAKVTGWDLRSNQHERDAAMIAWAYRGAA